MRHRGRVTLRLRENHFHDCRTGCVALVDYLGLNATTPELSEATLFTPCPQALVVDVKDAAAAEQARKESERESIRDVSPA